MFESIDFEKLFDKQAEDLYNQGDLVVGRK